MSSTEGGKTKTARELRRFGFVMAGAFGVFGVIAVWRDKSWGVYSLALAGAFFLVGLIFPRLLAPIEAGWMAFARVMSVVMTYVILTLSYYLVITPMGLLMRLLGKDLLELKRKPAQSSYWVPVDPDGPCGRPDKPY